MCLPPPWTSTTRTPTMRRAATSWRVVSVAASAPWAEPPYFTTTVRPSSRLRMGRMDSRERTFSMPSRPWRTSYS